MDPNYICPALSFCMFDEETTVRSRNPGKAVSPALLAIIRQRLVTSVEWSHHTVRVRGTHWLKYGSATTEVIWILWIPSYQNLSFNLHVGTSTLAGRCVWRYSKLSAYLPNFPAGLWDLWKPVLHISGPLLDPDSTSHKRGVTQNLNEYIISLTLV